MDIELTGNWYNKEVGIINLWLRVQLKLSNGTEVLLVPDLWEQTVFSFTLPVLSPVTDPNVVVSLLITATNEYDGSTTLTKPVIVDNTLSDSFRSSMYPVSFNASNSIEVSFLATQMRLTLSPPVNGLYSQEM
jgi:hypothetical protein